MKKALITGITGQDGYYLSKLLLEKGYEVHGTVRRASLINTYRIDELISIYRNGELNLHYSDLLDSASLSLLINQIQPDEVYNLAAQSHVSVSFKNPVYTTQVGTLGSVSILEAIRSADKEIKFYQASSSEMYGGSTKEKLNEISPFDPKSPYAASKVFAHDITKIYRESYDIFCVNGILFNHESPMRGETFVTKKIIKALVRIKMGYQKRLVLGNLDSKRDWGHARDYVEAMWKILQQKKPNDYVIATGKQHSIRQFINLVAKKLNMKIIWKGTGFNEVGYDVLNKKKIILVDKNYIRPLDVNTLLGNAKKARKKLKWKPLVNINSLISEMIEFEYKSLK